MNGFSGDTWSQIGAAFTTLRPNTRRYGANIYLFKVDNRNSRKRGEICSKLTMEAPERRQ